MKSIHTRTFTILIYLTILLSCNYEEEKAPIKIPPPPPPPKPWQCIDYELKNRIFSKDTMDRIEYYSKLAKESISEDDIYKLMNSAFFSTEKRKIPDSLRTKLVIKTETYKGGVNLQSIKELYPESISTDDILYMYSQLSCDSYYWSPERLPNVKCLSIQDIEEIFDNPENDDLDENWRKFRIRYGRYGLHNYSKPIFNLRKNVAIIVHEGSGGSTTGSGELYVLRKRNGTWRIIETVKLWIS